MSAHAAARAHYVVSCVFQMLPLCAVSQADWEYGAPAITTPCPVDCTVGYENWRAGWGDGKKAWCCEHEGIACEGNIGLAAGVPQSAVAPQTAGWPQSAAKPQVAVTTQAVPYPATLEQEMGSAPVRQALLVAPQAYATMTTTTPAAANSPPLMECWAGDLEKWSDFKKDWCCKHQQVGCPSRHEAPITTTSKTVDIHDCEIGPGKQLVDWTHPQKEWCCKHKDLGCFDCQPSPSNHLEQWGKEQRDWCCKKQGRGCGIQTAGTPSSLKPLANDRSFPQEVTRTTRAPGDILKCDLGCYGDGARTVRLPGSRGVGGGASLNDVSLEACRSACLSTRGCEAIMFTNKTKGVPFKTMCFGKRNIHTSRCQPGGAFVTEILGALPWGKCAIFGDPHVISFDRIYGPPVTMTDPGEFHLIKSDRLNIQGRFGYTRRFPTASSTTGIAVRGEFIKDHSLVVAYTGPKYGHEGFKVWWDGKRILEKYPSTFTSDDGVLQAKHDAMDPQKYHREGRHTIGGTEGLLPSYLFQLTPDLTVYVLIGPDNCNAIIETKKLDGYQDGYCGNFNCDQDDDALGALQSRGMASPISAAESIFAQGEAAPAWSMQKVVSPTLEDCDPKLKAKAEKQCRGLPNGEEEACIFDACATNSTEVSEEDSKLLALPYDCKLGSLGQWLASKKKWCCHHHWQPGCPEEGESTKKHSQEKEEQPDGCDSLCSLDSHSATCKARIHWAATHKFVAEKDPCGSAYDHVLQECSMCSNCRPALAGCASQEPQVVFFKRFEDQATSDNSQPVLASALWVAGMLLVGGLVAAAALGVLAVARTRSWRAVVMEAGEERLHCNQHRVEPCLERLGSPERRRRRGPDAGVEVALVME